VVSAAVILTFRVITVNPKKSAGFELHAFFFKVQREKNEIKMYE